MQYIQGGTSSYTPKKTALGETITTNPHGSYIKNPVVSTPNPWAGMTIQQIRNYETRPITGGTPPTTGKTPADLAAEAMAAYLNSLPKTQSTSSGGGGSSISNQSVSMPAYTPQAYQVNLPSIDWGFNPTEAQRGGWQNQATATAAQEIDPQLQAIQAALQAYMTQGQNQRNELNPRYTNQSLGIANIVKNTIKQEAIDESIRRNAQNSGWLPSALMEAGKTETQQRGDIEAQRNQDLSALAALEAQQTQAAGEQGTMLEGLRGQRITSLLAELENREWERANQEKQNQWNSAIGGEQLRASAYGENASNQLAGYQTQASVGMSNADRALQAAIASAEQGNVQYNQQYTAAQDLYQRQLQAAQLAAKGIVTKEPTYNVNINGQIIPLTQSQYLAWYSNTAPAAKSIFDTDTGTNTSINTNPIRSTAYGVSGRW